MAETPNNTNNGEIPCILVDCQNPNITSCSFTCLPPVDPYLLPPPLPPPPPPPPPPSPSHIAPFLIAIVCILGISFLLLTTCTIIFRCRFTRRRHEHNHTVSGNNNNNRDDDDDHSFVDHPIWYITTVGLQQSVIDSITAFKYKKIDGFVVEDSSDSSCSVCLTEFEDGDDLRMLPKCCHPFHVTCIDTWLRCHKNCPLCRAPVVNEVVPEGGDHAYAVNSSGGGGSGFGGESQRMNLDCGNGGEGSSRSNDLMRLPVLEGFKIAEILRRNRELRIFSDLGDHHRFRGVQLVDSVRRSVSFNGVAASVKIGAVMGAGNEGSSRDGSFGEGCSRGGNSGGVSQQKNFDLEKGGKNKRGSSMSGLLIKSSSIGRSLQKGPVSMKRSLSSSSSRFFSFRKSKSQASVLPL